MRKLYTSMLTLWILLYQGYLDYVQVSATRSTELDFTDSGEVTEWVDEILPVQVSKTDGWQCKERSSDKEDVEEDEEEEGKQIFFIFYYAIVSAIDRRTRVLFTNELSCILQLALFRTKFALLLPWHSYSLVDCWEVSKDCNRCTKSLSCNIWSTAVHLLLLTTYNYFKLYLLWKLIKSFAFIDCCYAIFLSFPKG